MDKSTLVCRVSIVVACSVNLALSSANCFRTLSSKVSMMSTICCTTVDVLGGCRGDLSSSRINLEWIYRMSSSAIRSPRHASTNRSTEFHNSGRRLRIWCHKHLPTNDLALIPIVVTEHHDRRIERVKRG